MNSEFAYSVQMQIILVFVTYAKTFISTYMIANLIVVAFNVSANRKQKLIFTFITGSILQNTFVYAVYFFDDMMSFNTVTYFLTIFPNPITAMLYYYTARIVFHLPAARSVKIMSYVYTFWITSIAFNRLITALFFVQDSVQYNYLMDAVQQISTMVPYIPIYFGILYFLKKTKVSLEFADNMFFNERRELFIYFLKAVFVYTISVLIRITMADPIAANIVITLSLVLLIAVNVCIDVIRYSRQTIGNRDAYISTLFKSIEELRGIKHDFNNLLHTYSGYLELKEYERLERYHASLIQATSHAGSAMELAQRMPENPAIIALLIEELEYAERMNVRLILSLKCGMEDLFIDHAELSRAISCLLRYAIDAASDAEHRKVYATIESKAAGSKLIIITGSAAPPASGAAKAGADARSSMLSMVRSILSGYENCTFQARNYANEFSFYIELRDAKALMYA